MKVHLFGSPDRTLVLLAALLLASWGTPALADERLDVESLRPGRLGFGFNYSTQGEATDLRGQLRVCGVAPGSPAEEAGLEVDDIIAEMDGEPFKATRHSEILLLLARVEPGQTVTFTVQRGTTTLEIPVTAGPTTPEQLERWRLNFRLAREQEAQDRDQDQDQEFVPSRADNGGS